MSIISGGKAEERIGNILFAYRPTRTDSASRPTSPFPHYAQPSPSSVGRRSSPNPVECRVARDRARAEDWRVVSLADRCPRFKERACVNFGSSTVFPIWNGVMMARILCQDLPDEQNSGIRESEIHRVSPVFEISAAKVGGWSRLTWFVNIKSTVSFFRILLPVGA